MSKYTYMRDFPPMSRHCKFKTSSFSSEHSQPEVLSNPNVCSNRQPYIRFNTKDFYRATVNCLFKETALPRRGNHWWHKVYPFLRINLCYSVFSMPSFLCGRFLCIQFFRSSFLSFILLMFLRVSYGVSMACKNVWKVNIWSAQK